MLILDSFAKTWPMCLASAGFFAAVALAAWRLRIPRLDRDLPPMPVFWVTLLPGFVLLAVCLTLIDRPHFDLEPVTLSWLFMFSAFLGIPVVCPLFAAATWALAHGSAQRPVRFSRLLLVMLGAFALGCAASNIHDIVWCGAITNGFAERHAAGYDLDLFAAFGRGFGIPNEITSDYATLGPYAMLLVAGELGVALAAFLRLRKMARNDAPSS